MTVQTMITVKDLPLPPAGKRGWPWTVGTEVLAFHLFNSSSIESYA
jgi:hypothetical protein